MTDATPRKGGQMNRLRALWREGQTTFGAIATIPSVQTVQVMARSGLDWILIDMEHGAVDLGTAHAMIAATSGTLRSCPWCVLLRVRTGRQKGRSILARSAFASQ